MRYILASNNNGKLREMKAILAETGAEVVSQREAGANFEAEETGETFEENALIKARAACEALHEPAIADDSGLIVDALGGAPGLHSARYAGRHGDAAANIARLLGELAGHPESGRGAHFHCSLVLLRHADDPAPLIAEGRWAGRILDAPRGAGGFGYDPVFLDLRFGRSAAELAPAEKNRVSHRGLALARLRELLETA